MVSSSYKKRRFRSYRILPMKKHSTVIIIGPARKFLLSPHCTLWLLNMQNREQSCTGLQHPFHHPKTLLWGLGRSSAFSLFFSPYRYDKNSSYNSTLEFHIFLQNKDYLKQTCSCHRICLIQRLAQPQGLLPLSQRAVLFEMFFSWSCCQLR